MRFLGRVCCECVATWGVKCFTMSNIVVQLGQCGNQIGNQLFSLLYSSQQPVLKDPLRSQLPMVTSRANRFFSHSDRGMSRARAVLIDMESKVIQNSLFEAKREGKWLYNERSVYYGKKGSGNNWANGYYQHGQRIREDVTDTIRKEVEVCDNLEGFLVLMSVAGGTGSGLGAYITELLRDSYPHTSIVNPVIWPYLSGDVIVQNYNALLTVAHLSEASRCYHTTTERSAAQGVLQATHAQGNIV